MISEKLWSVKSPSYSKRRPFQNSWPRVRWDIDIEIEVYTLRGPPMVPLVFGHLCSIGVYTTSCTAVFISSCIALHTISLHYLILYDLLYLSHVFTLLAWFYINWQHWCQTDFLRVSENIPCLFHNLFNFLLLVGTTYWVHIYCTHSYYCVHLDATSSQGFSRDSWLLLLLVAPNLVVRFKVLDYHWNLSLTL